MASKFAKRHYEALAETIQQVRKEVGTNEGMAAGVDMLAARIGVLFKKDNAQFDWARFIKACEPGNNVRARK